MLNHLPRYYSLSTILNRVKTIIDGTIVAKEFWLKAEIASINFHRSGQIYLELAENTDGHTVSKCRAIIWNYNQSFLREGLGEHFASILKKGNQILCKASIKYDIQYGLNIIIHDISLEFAIGNIEKKRKETMERLGKENLIDRNKALQVPVVVSTIALIASVNTSGYQDFIKNIQNNQQGYAYQITTFSTSVQGDNAELQILNQLITVNENQYDCVVIIRGGGSKMDLDVFNSYKISKQVALMRSPVLTGIGHETDVTVIDYACNKAFKTPTAVSNYILNKSYVFEQKIKNNYAILLEIYTTLLDRSAKDLQYVSAGISDASNQFTKHRRGALHTTMHRIISAVSEQVHQNQKDLELTNQQLLDSSKQTIRSKSERLKKHEEILKLVLANTFNSKKSSFSSIDLFLATASPENVLQKGFSIPRVAGKLYTGEELKKDTPIHLELKNKTIITKFVNIIDHGE